MDNDHSTTPLLQSIHASDDLQAYSDHKTAPASLDDAIESFTGGTSKVQFWQAFLASLAWVFDAQQTFINVFTDAQPPWHSITAAPAATNQCNLPRDSWTWDRQKKTSIISDWDLQCSPATVVGLPASAFFAGCLVGGLILATLADSKFGRKNMLFFTSLSMSISAGLTAASPNLAIYSLLRFVTGFSRGTIGTNALVLSTELVGRKWREAVGIMGFLFFTLGFLSLPLIAYMVRDHSWRTLYILTSMMSLVYSVIIFFILKESPRWLLVRGRRDEAMQVLGIKSSLSVRLLSSWLDMFEREEEEEDDVFSSMRVLWEKRWVFRRMVAAMIVGFGTGMVYYGMPLALGRLGSNLYVSVGMNALSEVPANLLILVLIERVSRRKSLLGFNVMSGLGCIMCVFIGRGWRRVVAEMVGFYGACSGFGILLVYAVELFPTTVRNSAVMMVREAMVLGGVAAPVMVAAGNSGSGLVSFGAFGLVIVCFSLFVVCLPETRGRRTFDTLEEEEKIEKNSSVLLVC